MSRYLMLKAALTTFLILTVPIGSYLADFLSGYLGFSLFHGFFVSLLISFIWSPTIAVIISFFIFRSPFAEKFISFIFICVLCFLLSILGTPAGAKSYSQGFEMAMKYRTDLGQIQSWAQEVIQKHRSGDLELGGPTKHGTMRGKNIPPSEIPALLQKGIFIDQGSGPSICITIYDTSETCVEISWDFHGILVGSPNYKTSYQPWYIHEIKPGIYSFHIER